MLATRNPDKLGELQSLVRAAGYRVRSLAELGLAPSADEDALERWPTFEENARAKADYFAARLRGAAVLADDSGLEVIALGGAPGVRSRRYADDVPGPDADAKNVAKLLGVLGGAADRRAAFVTALAYRGPAGAHITVGRVEGEITEAPDGSGGFGYDPVFRSVELRVTFGRASAEEKARVSHRARAVAAMLAWLGPAAAGEVPTTGL